MPNHDGDTECDGNSWVHAVLFDIGYIVTRPVVFLGGWLSQCFGICIQVRHPYLDDVPWNNTIIVVLENPTRSVH